MKGEREKPLALAMGFDEALRRFIGTNPSDLPDSIKLKKKERPKPPPVVEEPPEGGTD
jgi:hypothetical protein